jgi:hypothetical protein
LPAINTTFPGFAPAASVTHETKIAQMTAVFLLMDKKMKFMPRIYGESLRKLNPNRSESPHSVGRFSNSWSFGFSIEMGHRGRRPSQIWRRTPSAVSHPLEN